MDDLAEKDFNKPIKDRKKTSKNKKLSDSSSSDTTKKYKKSKSKLKSSKKEITKHKHRRKRHPSDSSSSSLDSSSSSSINERRQETKKKKKTIKKIKELKVKEIVEDAPSMDIPLHLMSEGQSMAPMTKEEWEKKQSVVKRVYDESTGRNRLIKGDGEVIEEIVSKDRHNKINQDATKGDGDYFQKKIKLI